MNKTRFIVWLASPNKKVKINQFHTEANTMEEAISNMKSHNENIGFKIMGISNYDSLCVNNELAPKDSFINNRFL